MIILHVTAPAEFGGLERVVQDLAIGQRSMGHDAHVAAVVDFSASDHSFLRPLEAAGVPTVPIRLAPRRYLCERSRVAELCRVVRPAVVHTHGYRCDVLDSAVARGLGIPTVTTVHGFAGGGVKNRFYEWLQIRSFRRFAAVVAVSRSLHLRLSERIDPEKLHFIPNAWSDSIPVVSRDDARERLGLPRDDFVVGWIGRLSREKGADLLIEALGQLSDLPIRASIIGDGREKQSLRKLAVARGVAEQIGWHGMIEEAGRLIRAFDAVVLSSRTEGTPMVLFEAIGAGVPVAASAVGGVPEVVSRSQALLVESENVEQLAAAIWDIYEYRESAAERARSAQETLLSKYSKEPWLRRYDRVYETVQ